MVWQRKKTACLLGIRANESLNRYRAIVMDKTKYKNKNYSTLVKNETYNFYPIYDWTVDDIWTYNGKFEKTIIIYMIYSIKQE